MADATLTFTTQTIGGEKLIRVDKKAVKLEEGKQIEFKNSLNGNPEMVVQFFGLGSSTPVSGFCSGISGTDLTVPGNASAYCTLESSANAFAYTAVTAPGTPPGKQHLELDPVIIITPSYSPTPLPFLSSPLVPALGGLAVLVLLVLAYRIGFRKGQQDRTAPAT